ncbi:MAG: bifunctional phosphoserine phosphatase/homoserine phosphotransferase ThrH [Bacteroidales bacterium]|nr:bifunctional phosphoserine phosphatase/homoserine phosphotransferase ThrH [Bacteroidales bacterium]
MNTESTMVFFCSDLEGVWVPEVWINVARITGIDELKLTTRDINDYDKLMRHRIAILHQYKITLKDIQQVISQIKPIDGAKDLLSWIRQVSQIAIVSDTFVEFAAPLMAQLDYPTLFCNSLVIDQHGMIVDYQLRQHDQKRQVVKALKQLNYKVIAFGDSYNDISMLQEANEGILFSPPENVKNDYPEFRVANNYNELKSYIEKYL